jgi:alkylhydroperoxidase/carboxymuconolactone decarboxylase family protein YurZ
MTQPTLPTSEQLLAMMRDKMGDTLPEWTGQLKELAPDLLLSTAMLSMGSVQRPESSIPLKYRHLMAVTAALGRRQGSCARSQAHMAMQEGATVDEVLDAVRIARHLMAAGVLDAASGILGDLAKA